MAKFSLIALCQNMQYIDQNIFVESQKHGLILAWHMQAQQLMFNLFGRNQFQKLPEIWDAIFIFQEG